MIVERTVFPLRLDVYNCGIARAERAQLLAYRSGVALSVKDLPSRVIGRPPAGTTIVPPGDARMDSGLEVNAIRHWALYPSKGAVEGPTLPNPNRRLPTDRGQKIHHCEIC